MQFHFHANQSHFHKNGFALRLALKQRHKGTRKWPILIQDPAYRDSFESQRSVFAPLMSPPFPGGGGGVSLTGALSVSEIFIKCLQQAFLKAFFLLVSRRRIFAFFNCCNESNLVRAGQNSRASAKAHQLAEQNL